MELIYGHPKSLKPIQTKYCPGCGHGVIHRIIAEVVDELGVQEKSIITNPVGCSIWADLYFDFDSVQPAHGRTPAAATGVKRVHPDHLVICYQGDGDLAAIGTAEIIHAANRGEKFTTIFVNNAIYGMTGGQMAPTSLPGQKTSSSPNGRDVETTGFPIRMSEIIATMEGTGYVVRRSLHDPRNIRQAKKAIRTAFEVQRQGLGFAMVELLSTCPTNWGLTPNDARQWVEDRMIPAFPLGDYKVAPMVAALKI